MTPVQQDELVHILERRLEGPEYRTFCGLVVDLFAPAMLACWPRTMDRQREAEFDGWRRGTRASRQ